MKLTQSEGQTVAVDQTSALSGLKMESLCPAGPAAIKSPQKAHAFRFVGQN